MRRIRMRRTLLAGVLCAAFLAVVSRPAAANCLGPTIEIDQRKIAPGEEIKVLGSWWGDNCYDTGPPPEGEGVLGVPINGIDIYVVQGDREWLIAAGSADAHYGFTATATAPADLTLGDARVQARSRQCVAYSSNPNFVVIDAPRPAGIDKTVVSFGPSASTLTSAAPRTTPDAASISETSISPTGVVASQPTTEAATDGDKSSTTTLLILGGIAVALVALAAAVLLARSRRD
jgi:hypothetical protein